MKKVKIMLMAIAVVAVSGGLVAAKVNRSTAFCITATTNSTTCATPTSPASVTGTIGSGTTKVCTAALDVNQHCPTSGYKTAFTTTD